MSSTKEDMMFGVSPVPTRRFVLYLPERDKNGSPIADFGFWLSEASLLLCVINGGVTHLTGEGMWHVATTDEIVREPVHLLISSVRHDDFLEHIAVVRRFIERFGRATNQDAIAVEYDGKSYFIPVEQQQLRAVC